MGRPRSYTDQQFRVAVRDSISIGEVLDKLGLRATGGNYTHFKFVANKLAVDYSHFKGQRHLAGKHHGWTKVTPLEEILVENSTYSNRGNIKSKLLGAGLLVYKCSICEIDSWREKRLTLHLDHINGNPTDHRLENLRLLCPNCHSQTITYSNKRR